MASGYRLARLRVAAALLLAGGAAGTVEGGHYSWTTSGPEAGFVYQIVVSPDASDQIQVSAGIFGRLLFSTADRGLTWGQSGSLVFVGRLLQDPSRGNVLYTIGSSASVAGVLKTTDGGASWSDSSSGLPALVDAIALSPSAPDTLYAVVGGSPGSAFRSTDGAATWSLVSNALAAPYLGDLLVDPADPATVYALAPDKVLKSFDGGATWVPLPLGPAIQRLYFGREQPAVLYATVSGAGVSASTDAGASWQSANAGIADHNILDLAFDPVNPQKIYAASSGSSGTPGGLFVSTDHAQSWTPVDLGVPVNVSTAVAFDPRDASLVYAAAGPGAPRGGLLASADGGATWARREKGLSGYYNNAVAGHPSAGATAYCASGSRVYRTDDSGAGWALQATIDYPIDSLALDPTGNGTLYAGYGSSAANGVLKSVDGGMSWNPATQGISTSLLRHVEIGQTAPDHLLAATTDGIFGTVDGGGLWTPLLSGDARAAAIDPADPAILYAGLWSTTSPGDGLLRSPDGGATWNAPSGLPTAYPHVFDIAITRSDPTRVYAAFYGSGSGQGVYRSVDRGLSFAPAVAGLPDQFWALDIVGDPSRAATLYVTGQLAPAAVADGSGPTADVAEGTIVYRTTNGADSWMAVPGSLPVFSVLDFAVGADGRTLYASTQSGAFQFARSFLDVPDADPFWTAVDAAAMNGVTAGCGAGKFCPAAPTSRAGIAVFLLRGKNGAFYTPPPATGAVFGDVPAGAPAAAFIEALAATGVTAGCGGGDYCPAAPLTRAAMAVLLLKTEHGSDFVPPPATGTVFADVPADAFAAAWIEQLAAEGVTAGCGAGNFCPDATVSRAQAAALVVRAFGLP